MLSRFFFLNNSNKEMLAPHAADIAVIDSSLILTHLPNHWTTFFSSSSQVVHWSEEIQTKNYDSRKEGRIERSTDRPSEWIRARSLNSYFAFCKIVVKTTYLRKKNTWNQNRRFQSSKVLDKLVPGSPFAGQNVRLSYARLVNRTEHSWRKTILSRRCRGESLMNKSIRIQWVIKWVR